MPYIVLDISSHYKNKAILKLFEIDLGIPKCLSFLYLQHIPVPGVSELSHLEETCSKLPKINPFKWLFIFFPWHSTETPKQ